MLEFHSKVYISSIVSKTQTDIGQKSQTFFYLMHGCCRWGDSIRISLKYIINITSQRWTDTGPYHTLHYVYVSCSNKTKTTNTPLADLGFQVHVVALGSKSSSNLILSSAKTLCHSAQLPSFITNEHTASHPVIF